MNTLAPLQIFKSGSHTAMSGVTISFSESDVAAIAASYDPAIHEAPLVVGHPATDDPAYGWVAGLQFDNGVLSALPSDVDSQFAELVNTRRFSKISAAFYEPNSPSNPVQGVYYLRHVGFLGAQPPSVKGLKSPQFASDDELVICFECSVPTVEFATGDKSVMTPEEIAAKQAELDAEKAKIEADKNALKAEQAAFSEQKTEFQKQAAKAKAADIDATVTDLVKQGKVLPKDKAGLIAFMTSDSPSDVIEFAEGSEVIKKTGMDWFKDFLQSRPSQVEFAEVTGNKTNNQSVDNKTIANRARAYKAKMDAQGVNLSYAEAVDGVLADEDKVGA